MNPWIRLYRDSLHNPKIVTLSDRQHRAWHNALLVTDDDGYLPSMRDIACHFRMTIPEAEQIICDLVDVGLIDVEAAGSGHRRFRLHDWSTHQYVSDSSKDRVRKHREKKKKPACNGDVTDGNDVCNGDVTRPDTDSETDSEPLLLPSEQEAMRKKKQGFDFGFGRGAGKADLDTVQARAEGLGLPVDELVATTIRNQPKNRTAYFTALCVKRLHEKIPRVPEQMVRDAMLGKNPAWTLVCMALNEAEVAA